VERDFEIEPRAAKGRAAESRERPNEGTPETSRKFEQLAGDSPCPLPCRYSDYRGPSACKQPPFPSRDLERAAGRKLGRQPDREPARGPWNLSDIELKLLGDVGRFRVVRAQSLERVYFAGRARACADALLRLRSAGLIEDRIVRRRAARPGASPEKLHLISLTKAGKKLVSSQPGHDRSQTLYAGLVKEREALHDSNLYPVYLAHAARLNDQGATVRRVVLDFELKQMYLRELRRREAEGKELRHSEPEFELKRAVAAQFDLPVLDGKVQFPGLRIEYEIPGLGPAKADIELATASYHHRHIAQRTRAGFTLYADPGERAQLGPGIRDDHDLMAGIPPPQSLRRRGFSFRHTVSAWGKEAGLDLEEVKTLLRREHIATTSDVYGELGLEAKRRMQARLVSLVKREAAPGVPGAGRLPN
jgi:hypothetical protein